MRWEKAWKTRSHRRVILAITAAAVLVITGVTVGGAADNGAEGAPAVQEQPPKEVVFPAPLGQVVFPHAMHVDDLGIDCADCHHPVTAPALSSPHPQYFKECQVACSTCHGTGSTNQATHACTSCHKEPGPQSAKLLSSKVALHQMCGNCHEIGTGKDASASCSVCHSGPRTPW